MTSPDDLADQLKLIAGKLAAPGWDPNPVTRARAVMLAGYPSLGGSPAGVLARDLEGLLHNGDPRWDRSEEHTSELQSLMRISYAVFCLKNKKRRNTARR